MSPEILDMQDGAPPTEKVKGGHVALYMQSFAGGGAERVMVNLARGLAARGLRVDLIVARAEGPYLSLVPPGVRLVDLHSRRSLTSLPGLVRYMRRERPDALLAAMGTSNLVALGARTLARFRGRVVLSVHINLSVHYRNAETLSDRLFPLLFRWLYPKADAVVAVSEEAALDLRQVFRLPAEQVRMIYNPVVSPALFLSAAEPVEHPWLAPGQPPVVLSVGRLCPQKDFLTLLQAFALVRTRVQARLVILGEGPDRAVLETAVADLGLTDTVSLPGFVPNPYAYMARAATYALSSRWEGLPTVLIEALACGTRIVSTDCPSGPREILRDGLYGTLVPVGDPAALAAALEVSLREQSRAAVPRESWSVFEADYAAADYEKVLFPARL